MADIKSKIKRLFPTLVGISTILGCVVSIVSCMVACDAVEQIINLKVEIQPVVEKFQKDSVFVEKIIERPQVVMVSIPDSGSQTKPIKPPVVMNPIVEDDTTKHLTTTESNNLKDDRDSFLERMQSFINRMKNL